MNQGFNISDRLYLKGSPVLKSSNLAPAISATACPAAVSHSQVGPRRGYISALPSATRQILSELPAEMNFTSPYSCLFSSTNFFSSGLAWERLPTMMNGRLWFRATGNLIETSTIFLKTVAGFFRLDSFSNQSSAAGLSFLKDPMFLAAKYRLALAVLLGL